VLFLVLVYYSMGSRFILQPGIQVRLPASSFVGPQGNYQMVSLTGAPNPAIYYRDQRVSLPTLLQRLEDNPSAERMLILRADRDAPSGLTMELLDGASRRGYTVLLAGEVPKP